MFFVSGSWRTKNCFEGENRDEGEREGRCSKGEGKTRGKKVHEVHQEVIKSDKRFMIIVYVVCIL